MRAIAFFCFFFLFWITTSPFVDLRNPDVLLATEDGSAADQICVLMAFAGSLVLLWRQKEAVRIACSPALFCVLAWGAVTVVTSTHPELSARRYVLAVLVIAISLATMLTPRNEAQFGRFLAIGSGAVLALAYFGVMFLPDISIHNLAEVLEIGNAGSWRGHFPHKNMAGVAMVYLIIYGMYVARRQNSPIGLSIVVLSAVFLVQTHNKTSLALVAGAFVLAGLADRTRSFWLKICFTILPVSIMFLFTVGSVIFMPIKAIVAAITSDPTFTNRTMIWTFSLDNIERRPFVGYGFEAFWNTSELLNGGGNMESAAVVAGHAHDAYLNVALTMGIPGLLLTAWWIIWLPLKDFHRAQSNGNGADLRLMYLRIWLFTLLFGCLESPFFVSHWPIWFGFLGAVFGVRLHANAVQSTDTARISRATVQGRPRQDDRVLV